MKLFIVATLVGFAHGGIHLLGFAKAFGLLSSPLLKSVTISKPTGGLWLIAGLMLFASAVLSYSAAIGPAWRPVGIVPLMVMALAVLLSQGLIISVWREASFGTIANLVLVLPIVFELLELRSTSFRSLYLHEAEVAGAAEESAVVTEADLAPLPPQIQRYLRRTGSVGRPRVRDIEVTWRGEMKSDPKQASAMPIEAIQFERFEGSNGPSRYFLIYASRQGIPFQAFHRYDDAAGGATMNVRIASLVDVVQARGEKMTQSETVTLFNDMCMLAPSTLIDATTKHKTVMWGIDLDAGARQISASFTNAGHTIHADLIFNAEGDLVDFISKTDRFLSADGVSFEQYPWSTPLASYRNFGDGYRIASRGDAIWKKPDGDYVYARFELASVRVNRLVANRRLPGRVAADDASSKLVTAP